MISLSIGPTSSSATTFALDLQSVAGRHRLEACIELGMDEIPVVAETGLELEARLWEIAENLHRAELTALERAEQSANGSG